MNIGDHVKIDGRLHAILHKTSNGWYEVSDYKKKFRARDLEKVSVKIFKTKARLYDVISIPGMSERILSYSRGGLNWSGFIGRIISNRSKRFENDLIVKQLKLIVRQKEKMSKMSKFLDKLYDSLNLFKKYTQIQKYLKENTSFYKELNFNYTNHDMVFLMNPLINGHSEYDYFINKTRAEDDFTSFVKYSYIEHVLLKSILLMDKLNINSIY